MTEANTTENLLHAYRVDAATRNDQPKEMDSFAVLPSEQHAVEADIQAAHSFLQQINCFAVRNAGGPKLLAGLLAPTGSRTDTDVHDRQADNITHAAAAYACLSTEYDVAFSWAWLDAAGRDGDEKAFAQRLDNELIRRQAYDRLLTGFNGAAAVVESDASTNPSLQDLNIGWLQCVRSGAPSQVVGTAQTYGSTGDFATLDALVAQHINAKLPEAFRADPDLRVIVGPDLMHGQGTDITDSDGHAATALNQTPRIAGRRAIIADLFPPKTIFVTALRNLSLYYQIGERRTFFEVEPRLSRFEVYTSSNDAYVVEDPRYALLLDDVSAV